MARPMRSLLETAWTELAFDEYRPGATPLSAPFAVNGVERGTSHGRAVEHASRRTRGLPCGGSAGSRARTRAVEGEDCALVRQARRAVERGASRPGASPASPRLR